MAEPKIRRRKPGWKIEPRICVVCSIEFKRKKRGNDAQLCCSRKCGFTLQRWRGEQSRLYVEARDYLLRWGSRPRNIAKARLRKARSSLLASIILYRRTMRPCEDCGLELGRISLAVRMCPLCSKRRERQSPSRRADKAYRKALERGRIHGAERFDPLEVLARDGWRCHICGINTPKRLRGTYHEQAPELDHIIPLALGGQHTRLNTACACRKCNIEKGSQQRGQLRLVA